MSLEVIYVVRHGFRSSWSVDHVTGTYTSYLRTPTGLPTDPALTSHGVEQANELATHLAGLRPPIDQVYSSPYYRCLQTISPFVSRRNSGQVGASHSNEDTSSASLSIRVEPGLGEWYGRAHFEHPGSAPLNDLSALFADLDANYVSAPAPRRCGESISQLYRRVATCIEAIITQCDKEGKKAIIISTHAAIVITLGRVLTAKIPRDVTVEDFGAFTCGLSVYRRQGIDQDCSIATTTNRTAMARDQAQGLANTQAAMHTVKTQFKVSLPTPSHVVDSHQSYELDLSSRWRCEVDSDCSFLRGGEERGWKFSGDESFVEVDPEASSLSTLDLRPTNAVKMQDNSSACTIIPKL
ncbi:RNA polymerase III transcription initiation factor complex component [Nemania sp. FL0916]|nr:RNA polymerase III transcription initiation factor complex component [Nemania sp. FL0916]